MHIVALATQKGGSGKSALAASLAVAATAAGEKVAALDLDPQQTLFKWGQRRLNRQHLPLPPVDHCHPHELQAVVDALRVRKFGLLIIDTPGAQSPAVATALQLATFAVTPVKPTIADLQAVQATVETLRALGIPSGFVLNQCFPGTTSRTNEAMKQLLTWGDVAPAMLSFRVDYVDAEGHGLGVSEFNPNGKAAQEISVIWAWLKGKLGGYSGG